MRRTPVGIRSSFLVSPNMFLGGGVTRTRHLTLDGKDWGVLVLALFSSYGVFLSLYESCRMVYGLGASPIEDIILTILT
jgi:hypothetical protein